MCIPSNTVFCGCSPIDQHCYTFSTVGDWRLTAANYCWTNLWLYRGLLDLSLCCDWQFSDRASTRPKTVPIRYVIVREHACEVHCRFIPPDAWGCVVTQKEDGINHKIRTRHTFCQYMMSKSTIIFTSPTEKFSEIWIPSTHGNFTPAKFNPCGLFVL
jgi:hypothetical protein